MLLMVPAKYNVIFDDDKFYSVNFSTVVDTGKIWLFMLATSFRTVKVL